MLPTQTDGQFVILPKTNDNNLSRAHNNKLSNVKKLIREPDRIDLVTAFQFTFLAIYYDNNTFL